MWGEILFQARQQAALTRLEEALSEQIRDTGGRCGTLRSMTRPADPFRYFNSSPEAIRLVVMMYVRGIVRLKSRAPMLVPVASTLGLAPPSGGRLVLTSDLQAGRR